MVPNASGDDPAYDLPQKDKDRLEALLRAEADTLHKQGHWKDASHKKARANEISRRRSKRAHQRRD